MNLYLHGFTDPHIFEYDTLTSEERWNEFADVILANPPFMSPKGGIKPHKRFSIQAKRSEVLFVDYMAEHLTPTGRAAIIVPEGIIFQSQTAYKELRKMLVENSLVAVVSLPAGCFNPYSGVKTSILILDKSLARQSDTIGFFKVEADGFGLGAQRRAIEKNDLPQVQAELETYLQGLRSGQFRAKGPASSQPGATPQENVAQHAKGLKARPISHADDGSGLQPSDISEREPGALPQAGMGCAVGAQFTIGLIVPKEKIAANGDYNLSGERYREGAVQSTHFPWRTVESLVETVTPPTKIQKTAFGVAGRFPIIDQSQDAIAGWTDDESAVVRPTKPLVIFGDHTCAVKLIETPFAQGADGIKILQTIDELEPCFLFHVLRARPLESDGYQRHYSKLKEHQIPLPPMEVQKEIVAEIEGYQKVINGARAVLDHYRPHIPIHPDWPMVPISDASTRITKGSSPTWQGIEYTSSSSDVLFVTSENVGLGELLLDSPKYVERRFNEIEPKSILKKGDVLTNIVGASIGRTAIFDLDADANVNQAVCVIRPNFDLIMSKYLMTLLNSPEFIQRLLGNSVENARANVSMGVLGGLTIPLPPLATQQAIVAEIGAEQALVAANRELITRFERKIQASLARIWGEASEAGK